jgi:hypothetical protein
MKTDYIFTTLLRRDDDSDIIVEIGYDVDGNYFDAVDVLTVKHEGRDIICELSNDELMACETLAMTDYEGQQDREREDAKDRSFQAQRDSIID